MDREGNIIEKVEVNEESMKEENIQKVLESFIGKQNQIPPMYSAIKLNGKKLYEYAREGKEIEVKPRQIEIYNIKLKSINEKENTIDIIVYSSKGTYIRVLCQDIAEKLNTIGIMNELNRIKVRRI